MQTLLKLKLSLAPRALAGQGSETLVIVSGICGLLIHIGFTGLFLLLDLWPMAALNVLSSAVWLCIIWLAANDKPGPAVQLATLEVVFHAVLATFLLGPSFGFHFYLWPVSILIALNPNMKFRNSALISMLAILIFGCLSTFVSTDRSTDYTGSVVDTLFFSNILVSGFSMVLAGMLVRRMFSMQRKVLQQHARTDELTQLFNRRYMQEFLNNTEANRRRNHISYCVCLCDLDHFKSVNDVYGHDIGDAVLVNFADFLKQSIRKSDCVARWGGEEFLIILTNTNGADAAATIEILLNKLRTDKQIKASDKHLLSMSVGIAEAMGEISVDELIIRADQALYRAKSEGRDRAVLHQPEH